MRLCVLLLLGAAQLSFASLVTEFAGHVQDTYWNNTCTFSGTSTAIPGVASPPGCDWSAGSAGIAPQRSAADYPVPSLSNYVNLDSSVGTWAYSMGQGYASVETLAGFSDMLTFTGAGRLWIDYSMDVSRQHYGWGPWISQACSTSFAFTHGGQTTSIAPGCASTNQSDTFTLAGEDEIFANTPFPIGGMLDLTVSSDARTGADVSNSISAFASTSLTLYHQRQYWYDPTPRIQLSSASGHAYFIQQIELAPAIVPEPSTFLPLLLSLAVFGAARRRRSTQ